MPRKLSLSPVQSEVLRLLAEAGDEDLRTVIASVEAGGDTLRREIAALESLGYVRRTACRADHYLVITADGQAALAR